MRVSRAVLKRGSRGSASPSPTRCSDNRSWPSPFEPWPTISAMRSSPGSTGSHCPKRRRARGMSLRSPICPSSHKEKKMSDAELDEGTPITLEDAAYVARDGIILLECVNGIDDARAGRGELTVHTDTGSFNLRVDLPTEQSPAKLRENHGGVWGEYPEYPANDWRLEVENHDHRTGLWEWVAAKIEQDERENRTGEHT